MKNLEFKGQRIERRPEPSPRKNQIWKSVDTERLILIISRNLDINTICEDEDGRRFSLGQNWFDGESYTFVGTIKK